MPTSNGYVMAETPERLGRLDAVPALERGSRGALLRRLDDDGYLFLTGQIDAQIVESFRRYYFQMLAETGLEGPTDQVDQARLRHLLFREIVPGEAYAALCSTPQVKDWFSWFLGGPVHLHRRKIIRHTRPQAHDDPRTAGIGAATQAHYDLLYLRGGSDRVLSMWIPLGPCPVELGGLVYLEGSHHRIRAEEEGTGRRRPAASITADLPSLADEHDARWLYADYAPGDVVVHTAHTVHAALDNVDPAGRMRLYRHPLPAGRRGDRPQMAGRLARPRRTLTARPSRIEIAVAALARGSDLQRPTTTSRALTSLR